ncbi:hypothetical protein IEO21_06437 [Rhodonia placenta]|uniref:F-box domain-containing protein n=1 Tax=Rhodonia placenta TaxID=104341 RepID=A0A8H7P026_9APHY|nr:hypothetical protein IEO21_06437 [Postia placenta]
MDLSSLEVEGVDVPSRPLLAITWEPLNVDRPTNPDGIKDVIMVEAESSVLMESPNAVSAPDLVPMSQPKPWILLTTSQIPYHPESQPPLPLEVFEYIIDIIAEELTHVNRYHNLLACALTCRAWYPRSRTRLLEDITIDERWQLVGFTRMLKTRPALAQRIYGLCISGRRQDLMREDPRKSHSPSTSPLVQFPLMLARKLPSLEALTFDDIYFVDEHDPSFVGCFRCLSEFTSVTKLTLTGAHFTSPLPLMRLLSSLPNLAWFSCGAVMFLDLAPGPNIVVLQSASRIKLSYLSMGPGTTDVRTIIDLLTETGMVSSITRFDTDANGQFSIELMEEAGIFRILELAAPPLKEIRLHLFASHHVTETANRVVEERARLFIPALRILSITLVPYLSMSATHNNWVVNLFSKIPSNKVLDVVLLIKPGNRTAANVFAIFDAEQWSLIDEKLSRSLAPSRSKGLKVEMDVMDKNAASRRLADELREGALARLPRLHFRRMLTYVFPLPAFVVVT